MRYAAILLLVLSTGLALADGPPTPTASAVYARPLHRLTLREARKLRGKRGLFYVRVKSATRRDDCFMCRCKAPDGCHADLWLRPGQKAGEAMVVEATLQVCEGPGEGEGNYFLDDAVGR